MTASVFDQLDAIAPRSSKGPPDPVWLAVCVCGHPRSAHPVEHGGTKQLAGGDVIEGCIGAGRGHGDRLRVLDHEAQTMLLLATCPCREWRPVCEFDRPRRSCFWSAIGDRHPLLVAMQSFRTTQEYRKGFTQEQAKAEADRRFRWIAGARRCARCGAESDDVWPRFVSAEKDSEMRCEEHTP